MFSKFVVLNSDSVAFFYFVPFASPPPFYLFLQYLHINDDYLWQNENVHLVVFLLAFSCLRLKKHVISRICRMPLVLLYTVDQLWFVCLNRGFFLSQYIIKSSPGDIPLLLSPRVIISDGVLYEPLLYATYVRTGI
jgi:hypothetical protein